MCRRNHLSDLADGRSPIHFTCLAISVGGLNITLFQIPTTRTCFCFHIISESLVALAKKGAGWAQPPSHPPGHEAEDFVIPFQAADPQSLSRPHGRGAPASPFYNACNEFLGAVPHPHVVAWLIRVRRPSPIITGSNKATM
jgi:hypothetical protein